MTSSCTESCPLAVASEPPFFQPLVRICSELSHWNSNGFSLERTWKNIWGSKPLFFHFASLEMPSWNLQSQLSRKALELLLVLLPLNIENLVLAFELATRKDRTGKSYNKIISGNPYCSTKPPRIFPSSAHPLPAGHLMLVLVTPSPLAAWFFPHTNSVAQ